MQPLLHLLLSHLLYYILFFLVDPLSAFKSADVLKRRPLFPVFSLDFVLNPSYSSSVR
jgi:hypothetical protein